MPSSRLSELGQSSSSNGWNSEASVSVSTRCVVCTALLKSPVDGQANPYSKLEAALRKFSKKAVLNEYKMKDLEVRRSCLGLSLAHPPLTVQTVRKPEQFSSD